MDVDPQFYPVGLEEDWAGSPLSNWNCAVTNMIYVTQHAALVSTIAKTSLGNAPVDFLVLGQIYSRGSLDVVLFKIPKNSFVNVCLMTTPMLNMLALLVQTRK